ncbi:hypothetical protein KUTeg_021593 [Tegillarca granosa]|uniref:Uncharacterized protein n=1 Tax=Tegillarca granosa TaxID=220873 RepID=A0ABQ9E6X3_TEGGR|nr:hypothetical protein KUTeg_021593 [Tegillarca granosa]
MNLITVSSYDDNGSRWFNIISGIWYVHATTTFIYGDLTRESTFREISQDEGGTFSINFAGYDSAIPQYTGLQLSSPIQITNMPSLTFALTRTQMVNAKTMKSRWKSGPRHKTSSQKQLCRS